MNGANIIAIIILATIVIAVAVYLLHWLYRRSTKDISFVRTGFGGEKVVMGGGALVLPIVHDVTEVSMNTLRLEVRRAKEQSLITKDRMRVEVTVEFFVRVIPQPEAVATAARTLGRRTMNPESLKDLVQGRFVDAMGMVAATMTMEEMHEHRGKYIKGVRDQVAGSLTQNGLELETASLTSLDQTDIKLFNPSNQFDAEGLTRLTEEIQTRKKKRNDIEQDTAIAVRNKNLESEKLALDIDKESEYSRMEQEREIAMRRAQQRAEIAIEKTARDREIEEAQIRASEEIELSRIRQERTLEAERIERERETERLEVQRRRVLEIEEQDRVIAVATKSKSQSEAQAAAEQARSLMVEAQENVTTMREKQIADRRKLIELIGAEQEAEREAIKIVTMAEAEKKAAVERASADNASADAAKYRYEVDAEGQRALNEAENLRSDASRRSALHRRLVENLPEIIRESVKPIERIESIRILQVDGLPGLSSTGALDGAGGGGGDQGSGGGDGGGPKGRSLADSAVNAALRYRAQAPFVDDLLQQIGISAGSVGNLGNLLKAPAPKDPKPSDKG
ncbi:flotillin family protein [Hypericibacter sp.]|uniref:flotillin family protein n=1 Tax=Hypericibacter sp. TaxID=2705401 RepID=UPI003D6D6763